MRIVKPGYFHYEDEKEFVCPRCACEFLANKKDLKDQFGKTYNDGNDFGVAYVMCPWCKERINTII